MGASLEFPSRLGDCECGKPLDNKGFHLFTYKFGGDHFGHMKGWQMGRVSY